MTTTITNLEQEISNLKKQVRKLKKQLALAKRKDKLGGELFNRIYQDKLDLQTKLDHEQELRLKLQSELNYEQRGYNLV